MSTCSEEFDDEDPGINEFDAVDDRPLLERYQSKLASTNNLFADDEDFEIPEISPKSASPIDILDLIMTSEESESILEEKVKELELSSQEETSVSEENVKELPSQEATALSPQETTVIPLQETITPQNEPPTQPPSNSTNFVSTPDPVSAPSNSTPKSDPTVPMSALRKQLRATQKNERDFVSINLDSMSALALADIKRFSLNSNAIVEMDICKARNLHPLKSGPVSPMCLIAIRKDSSKDHEKKIEVKKSHEQTSVMPRNSNPVWNEHKELLLDQVGGESQRWLVLEVRDKSPKGDCVGFVELNLNNIADLTQREEWFTLQRRKKKDKVSGELLLRIRIRPDRKVPETIVIRKENFPTIPSFIYSSFWNSHCVKQVSVTHCEITSIPEGFTSLKSLEMLQLHHNNITTIPRNFGEIFSLKLLDVSFNRISTLPNELSNLKNLQVLNIESNKWTEQVPRTIFDLDVWCEIIGKPQSWDSLIDEELRKRESRGSY